MNRTLACLLVVLALLACALYGCRQGVVPHVTLSTAQRVVTVRLLDPVATSPPMRQPVAIGLKPQHAALAGTNRVYLDLKGHPTSRALALGYLAALDGVPASRLDVWAREVLITVSNLVGHGSLTVGSTNPPTTNTNP